MGEILGYYLMPHPPIVIPEIGRGEEIKAEKTIKACERVGEEIAKLRPDVIILITPHGPVFRDAIALSSVPEIKGSFKSFGFPTLKMEVNMSMHLTENIIRHADVFNIPVAPVNGNSTKEYDVLCELDHGAMVPLHFINKDYTGYELVHITYGMLPRVELYRFGMAVKKAVNEDEFKTVIIASGDLSHRLSDDGPYEYNPAGEEFDRSIVGLLERGDVEGVFSLDRKMVEAAGECGLRSIYIMLGAMEGKEIKGNVLSYEGPYGVGYGVISFDFKDGEGMERLDKIKDIANKEMSSRRSNESVYVRLARESLEHYLREGDYMEVPDYLPQRLLEEQRGVFVSLKKDGELRGCIGTISPAMENVAREIIRNAVEAGEYDPRFYPVDSDELDDLEYSVDVLMPAEGATRPGLDPQKYGVIVRSGDRTGLLLPALEGIDTVDKQLDIALKKAGISEVENYEIQRFEVIRYR